MRTQKGRCATLDMKDLNTTTPRIWCATVIFHQMICNYWIMKASILLLLLSPIGPTSAAAGFVTNLVPARTMSPSSYALTMELPKPENWAPFKQAERPMQKKNQHFKSRPLVDFQKDLEAGKVRYVTTLILFRLFLDILNLTHYIMLLLDHLLHLMVPPLRAQHLCKVIYSLSCLPSSELKWESCARRRFQWV